MDGIGKMDQIVSALPAGPSLKFCRVAAGETDTYPRPGRTMEWDTVAGDAVLRVAGGIVVDLDGHPLVYNKGGPTIRCRFRKRAPCRLQRRRISDVGKIGR